MLYVRELCVTMLMCERVFCDRGMCGRVMCDSGVVREFCVIMVLCDRVVYDNRVVLHSCTTDPCVTRILCDVLMCVCGRDLWHNEVRSCAGLCSVSESYLRDQIGNPVV
jgi:hypothetical protein